MSQATANKSDFFQYVVIDDFSSTPKYRQLAQSIIAAIQAGHIRPDDVLPSINELSFEFEISRDTAEKGYKHLKKMGLLGSVPGKGYYVKASPSAAPIKIFLLFNKLSEHKKIIYDSFAATLGEAASIDFYIYNNDFGLFKKLLLRKKEDYSFYVIIGHFLEGNAAAAEIINTIPKEKLILLDKLIPGVDGDFGAVYENFERDIFSALEQAIEPLRKYNTIKLAFPEYTYHPIEIVNGFEAFCRHYGFDGRIVHRVAEEPIHKGDVFINLVERDLVILIERILTERLTVGQDVGVISYNEIPLKKFILNGITTMSSDFRTMGEQAAQLILNNSKGHVEVPFTLRLRNSL